MLENARDGLVEVCPRGGLVVGVETGLARALDRGADQPAYSGPS